LFPSDYAEVILGDLIARLLPVCRPSARNVGGCNLLLANFEACRLLCAVAEHPFVASRIVRQWLADHMDSRRFRFGLFEFDAAIFELRLEGALVRLQSQPAQVLACLVERADQVVSRDDLRKAVWGEETFVDFERGLNFCISQIRSALKDDPANPTYIRTVPKSGYQFIAPVQHIPTQAPESPKKRSRAAQPFYCADSCSGILIDRFGHARVPYLSFPVRPKCN